MTDLLDTGALGAGPLDDAVPEGGVSSRPAITPRDAWRKAKLPLVLGAMLVVVAVLQAIANGPVSNKYLDPTATGNEGSRAIVELLRDRGIDVREVTVPSADRNVTVVLPIPELVEPDLVAAATTAEDLVLVAPPPSHAIATGAGVTLSGFRDEDTVASPGCTHPDAVAAGKVLLGGMTFSTPEGSVACYGNDPSFAEVTYNGQRTTFLGSGALFTNEHLDEQGNAALALRLLTRHPVVEWVYPRTFPTSDEEEDSLLSLLPHNVYVFVAQLFVVVLMLALWRARRLGPVVVEPLPVVVRAAEAVEGRARLYQSARARGRAADALRAGLRDRLVRTLGLASDASRETLVLAVTARTRGRDAVDVDALLYGPPPPDDPSLVRFADDLDRLYSEVRDL